MTRKNTIYVVVWPSIRVVKVGYSSRKGNRGGGYLECFRIPGDLTTGEVLEFIDYQLESIHAQA